jgi:hypothetical protein
MREKDEVLNQFFSFTNLQQSGGGTLAEGIQAVASPETVPLQEDLIAKSIEFVKNTKQVEPDDSSTQQLPKFHRIPIPVKQQDPSKLITSHTLSFVGP